MFKIKFKNYILNFITLIISLLICLLIINFALIKISPKKLFPRSLAGSLPNVILTFYPNTFDKNNHINIDVNIIHNLSSIKKEIDFSFINQFFTTNSKENFIYICCRSKGSLERVSKILQNNLSLNLKYLPLTVACCEISL